MKYKFYSINKEESLKISNEFNIKWGIYIDKVKAFYNKHGLHITNSRNSVISDIKLSDYRKRGLRGESVTSKGAYRYIVSGTAKGWVLQKELDEIQKSQVSFTGFVSDAIGFDISNPAFEPRNGLVFMYSGVAFFNEDMKRIFCKVPFNETGNRKPIPSCIEEIKESELLAAMGR